MWKGGIRNLDLTIRRLLVPIDVHGPAEVRSRDAYLTICCSLKASWWAFITNRESSFGLNVLQEMDARHPDVEIYSDMVLEKQMSLRFATKCTNVSSKVSSALINSTTLASFNIFEAPCTFLSRGQVPNIMSAWHVGERDRSDC